MRIEATAALVTGGASGLGLAAATALQEAGAAVTVADLPAALARGALPSGIEGVATDVTDLGAVEAAVAAAGARGPLRIAVNCAGIGVPQRLLPREGTADVASMTREVTVNLLGTLHGIVAAAGAIAAQELVGEQRGVIVNTASIAAFDGQIGQLGYAASKGGVVSMTLPAARELASRVVRVVTVAPGLFATPMFDVVPDDVRARLAAGVPHPARLGDPAEFAALVMHAVANPMLNGETIRLDGALRMAPR